MAKKATGSQIKQFALDAVAPSVQEVEDIAAEMRQQAATPFVVAATAAAMTDKTKAYVYTGSESGYTNGAWYYWNGSAWTMGGTAVDPTLSIAGAPADAAKVGELKSAASDLDADMSNLVEWKQLLLATQVAANTNTALTNNGDGSYLIGTTDYGNTTFGYLMTLEAGDYYLFGVPEGIAYLSTVGTSASYANRVFENTTREPKRFHTDTQQSLWVCFRSPSKPSESYTIYPALYKHIPTVDILAGNVMQFKGYLDDNTDLNDVVTNGIYVLLSDRTYINAPYRTGFLYVGQSGTVKTQVFYTLGTTKATFIPALYVRYSVSSGTTISTEWQMISRGRKTPIRMACFGDSIMYGQNGDTSSRIEEQYRIPSIIAYNLNIETTNYGVGSQGYIGLISEKAYDNISSKDLTQFNAMLMCYGVNDGYANLGTWDSTDESTIMGQFNKIINYVFSQNQTIRLIVVAPYNGRNVGTFPKYWYGERSHQQGYVSRQVLSDTLKQACEYYNIPYIEQTNSPINGFTIQRVIGTDGVHPSATGYLELGAWLSGEIGKLIG